MIREIEFGSEEYVLAKNFRDTMLRIPLGLSGLSDVDLAGEDKQIHIAAFDGCVIVGTIVFKPLSDGLVKLRQMAVADSWQGKGLGRQLVEFCEDMLRSRGFKRIEMTARVPAQGFYERLGYSVEGDAFGGLIPLPTIIMVKDL